MSELENLERALDGVERLLELTEDDPSLMTRAREGLYSFHKEVVGMIKEGLWLRFLEARENKPQGKAWKIEVLFKEVWEA